MKQTIAIVGLFVFSLVPTRSHASSEAVRVDVVTSAGVVRVLVGRNMVEHFGTKIDARDLTRIVERRNKKMKGKPEVTGDHKRTLHEDKVMWAADLLGQAKEPTAFPHLVALLDDPSLLMRGYAARALDAFGARRALPALLKVLHDKKPCNGFLVPAIAALGDDTAVPPLIDSIPAGGYRDADARLKAIEAITGLSLKEMREEWGLLYYGEKLQKFHSAMREWWEKNKHKSRNGKTAEPIAAADRSSVQAVTQKKRFPGETRPSRMLDQSSMLSKAYHNSRKSIEASEEFIREHPNDKDLCAGVLLRIAGMCAKHDKRKAIRVYQRAIDEYGSEILPFRNTNMIVEETALMSIGALERDIGNRDKALAIFAKLMKSSSMNTPRAARVAYLATKQSHLRLRTRVSVPKRTFVVGETIPVTVVVHNPEKESVTFECFVRIRRNRHKSYGAIAPRIQSKEIVLKPGEEFRDTFTFSKRCRLEPEEWQIDCSLNGIPFGTNSVIVQIVK